MIMMERKESCKLCGIKPKFFLDTKEYCPALSHTTLADGVWSTLRFGAEKDGTLFISAVGEEETDHYYPKFCPEFGRQLLKEKI